MSEPLDDEQRAHLAATAAAIFAELMIANASGRIGVFQVTVKEGVIAWGLEDPKDGPEFQRIATGMAKACNEARDAQRAASSWKGGAL
jgi:exopolyphosphatase/pppGpp-phosphohydrolase